MKLVVESAGTDLFYKAVFREAILEVSESEPRFALAKKIMKNFMIRLNDIKFKQETPSDNWISFSRFYGQAFFNVSLGVEEVSAALRRPVDEAQVKDLYIRFFELFEKFDLSYQKMTIQQQFSVEGDVKKYLYSLNPYTPEKFANQLTEKGVTFGLRIDEHDLSIYLVAIKSIIIEGGLYLNIDFEFSPNKYDSHKAYDIARNYYEFILEGLNLTIKTDN